MNYVEKFQQGGTANQDEQLNVLAGAMIQLQQLSQASEQGDKQAIAIMQEVQRRAQAMSQQAGTQMAKCGAKLKKKKGEQGLKLVKKPDCGCGARLKRVGGKLVNVDCNGNIIK